MSRSKLKYRWYDYALIPVGLVLILIAFLKKRK